MEGDNRDVFPWPCDGFCEKVLDKKPKYDALGHIIHMSKSRVINIGVKKDSMEKTRIGVGRDIS